MTDSPAFLAAKERTEKAFKKACSIYSDTRLQEMIDTCELLARTEQNPLRRQMHRSDIDQIKAILEERKAHVKS